LIIQLFWVQKAAAAAALDSHGGNEY